MDGIKQLNNVVGSDYVRSILTRKNTLLHMIDSYQKISGVSLTLIPPKSKIPDDWNWLPDSAINSGSGLGLVKIPTQQIKSINSFAVAPPFPIYDEYKGSSLTKLKTVVDQFFTVGLILIRLGHAAIAIAENENIVLTKVVHRYVRTSHKKGGQSANRFKRNREKWIQEFFHLVSQTATDRFNGYTGKLDWLAIGGDKYVVSDFIKKTTLPRNLSNKILPWRTPVNKPGISQFHPAVKAIWSSRVFHHPSEYQC